MSEPGRRQKLYGVQAFVRIGTIAKAQPLTSADDYCVGCSRYYNLLQVLDVSGSSGALLVFILNGLISLCVIGVLSEMLPTPNAIIEYIRHFGLFNLYTKASLFLTLTLAAAEVFTLWEDARKIGRVAAVFIFAPVVMAFINLWNVKYHGWLEAVGVFVKISFFLGIGVCMVELHGQNPRTQTMPLREALLQSS